MRALVMALLLAGVAQADPPRCRADVCAGLDDKTCALMLEANGRIAKDNDKREGGDKEQRRLEREAGGTAKLRDCEAWGRAHGKPEKGKGRPDGR